VRLSPIVPPREFTVGRVPVVMRDCGRVELAADEQLTLVTEHGSEYDVARKPWGFYATPSLNARLVSSGLRAVLVKSPDAKFFVLLVEAGCEPAFDTYCAAEGHVVVSWLDDSASLDAIDRAVRHTKLRDR